jgi:transcriptional regulator with XRE-family HTH domain
VHADELLRDARRRHGLTQRGLAAASGVPQPVIARIESGRQQPSQRVLAAVLAGVGERPVLSTEALPDAHDLGLLEVTLGLTPKERVRRLVALHRTAARWREAART